MSTHALIGNRGFICMSEFGIDHLILTKFNVRFEGLPTTHIHDLDWLTARLSLFTSICLPSVISQTRLPTAWLIFFDYKTPTDFLERFRSVTSKHRFIKCVSCEAFSVDVAVMAVHTYVAPDTSWLVTTRLDNDDAINLRFAERVRESARIGIREFLNFPDGLILDRHRLYRKADRSNAFITYSEPLTGCRTVFVDQHTRLRKYAPVRQVKLRDAWLQVIHGSNIANRARGLRVKSASVDKALFPDNIIDLRKPESLFDLVVDNTLGLVLRYCEGFERFIDAKTKGRKR